MKLDIFDLTIPRRDALRTARILESRAAWLERRREADTNIREYHQSEAKHSRRLAAVFREAL